MRSFRNNDEKSWFFREYVMALSAASVVNRLRLVETIFSIFDLDSDGKISKEEMEKMLHTLADVTAGNRKRRHHHHHHHRHDDDTKRINLQKRLEEAFNELNTNADEYITKDEFVEWYIKSGLLADVPADQIDVPNNSRIQQLNKRSRLIRRHRKEEHTQPVRYITHMTEQKTIPLDEDDDDDGLDEHSNAQPEKNQSEDNDSCCSKENERWQYLFNSVLGQIRAQRLSIDQTNNSNTQSPTTNQFNSWKRQGEEKLTSEYYRQKSSNVVTVRL